MRHAVLQWGETPYAIGKFGTYTIFFRVSYTIVVSCDSARLNDTYFSRTVAVVCISFAFYLCYRKCTVFLND